MTREEAISTLKKLLGFSPKYDEAISTLFPDNEQPQLPADVEEAAEQAAKTYEDALGYYECMNQWPSVGFKAGFKAGVEYERGKYELVYEGNGAIPDERGGYWPTDVKLYTRKEEGKK